MEETPPLSPTDQQPVSSEQGNAERDREIGEGDELRRDSEREKGRKGERKAVISIGDKVSTHCEHFHH